MMSCLAACASGGRSGNPDGSQIDPSGDANAANDAGVGSGAQGDAAIDAPAITSPFDISWCPGAQILPQQVLARFAPAATSAVLGAVVLDARQRQCQDQTGCNPWTSVASVPLYRINWTGNGFTFINGTDIAVPATGSATCTVPGPNCSVAINSVTSTIFPKDSSNPAFLWGVSPRISGAQVQVGNWSFDPHGNYLTWGGVTTTNTCLFGSENGRAYGASGTYVEYQMVIYGQY